MFTTVFSRSIFRLALSVFCLPVFLAGFCSRFLMPVTSSDSEPMVAMTSPTVVSGKSSPAVSMPSWMLTRRILYAVTRLRKAPSSRMPLRALLSLLITMVSFLDTLVSSCLHWGRSLSCTPSSMMTLSQPKRAIHRLSCSRPS